MIPSVAGCTTGSLYPRCPYIRDEVLSLYSKPRFWLRGPRYSRCRKSSVLQSTMCPKARSTVVAKRARGKVAGERWVLLASTASFLRLAAHLPGLVRPYRQARLCKVAKGSLRRGLIHLSAWKGRSRNFAMTQF